MSELLEYRFTTAEAAALCELPEKRIRKEFEHQILESADGPRVSFGGLVYLRTLVRSAIEFSVPDRLAIYQRIMAAMETARDAELIELADLVLLKLSAVRSEMETRGEQFLRWKEKLVEDLDIMGGETVFPDSRLTVRHIGEILNRGETEAAVLEDYPYLSPEDLEFARLYVRAYPRVGRPRAAGEGPPR